ncbi:MAG: 50S ribosomal protein L30 [uncultured bacterium]|nr:MAG: 50S ribosomal protein L30 [uncultured bacterium]OGT26950.1 MAG: 50S ribosomal protein L30 [Gammaproteobacteria bacterium RIFCSPHIGHO2_02_FULL_42_43]OGT28740.1 MAG: 50S ribosomal protein L30 [Gammaproteobacteria bacterium RIFCSPHIGHO2_01_FULL_42_8]OGT52169.1 MAG: 50S ribosomal protein L30 [Gammaproteobacteria bacterium RIFCSPHIGHO2_12_FULL_41_25]OGT62607.1 MAG: 50S ribosomal protein L30 [Gammaproteobacteria bacterium RIFCSPLOWO2_02_FULL_42_14]OGT86589.1 MAG: 50S ribosomal protein L30 [G
MANTKKKSAAKNAGASKKLKVTLTHSRYGRKPGHALCVKGLGLRRVRDAVVVEAQPAILGMINQVAYLVRVEEV